MYPVARLPGSTGGWVGTVRDGVDVAVHSVAGHPPGWAWVPLPAVTGYVGNENVAGPTVNGSVAGVTGRANDSGVTGSENGAGVTGRENGSGVTGSENCAGVTGSESDVDESGSGNGDRVRGLDPDRVALAGHPCARWTGSPDPPEFGPEPNRTGWMYWPPHR